MYINQGIILVYIQNIQECQQTLWSLTLDSSRLHKVIQITVWVQHLLNFWEVVASILKAKVSSEGSLNTVGLLIVQMIWVHLHHPAQNENELKMQVNKKKRWQVLDIISTQLKLFELFTSQHFCSFRGIVHPHPPKKRFYSSSFCSKPLWWLLFSIQLQWTGTDAFKLQKGHKSTTELS